MAVKTKKLNMRLTYQQDYIYRKAAELNCQKIPEFVRMACGDLARKTLGAVEYKRLIRRLSDEQLAIRNMTEEQYEGWVNRKNDADNFAHLMATRPDLKAKLKDRAASAHPENTTEAPDIGNDIAPYESPAAMQARIREDALQKDQ